MIEITEQDVNVAAGELLQLLDTLNGGEARPSSESEIATGEADSLNGDAPAEQAPTRRPDPVAIRPRPVPPPFELFAEDAVGYRGAIAARVAGITYRQLDYWDRTELVTPTFRGVQGARLYSVTDILVLKVTKRLLDTGITLSALRGAMERLRHLDRASIAHVTLMSNGNEVFLATSNDEIIDLVDRGEGLFGIAIGKVLQEIIADTQEFPPQIEAARRRRLA